MSVLLDVHGLTEELPTAARWVRPVNEVSLRINASESLGLVGESGSGKTMLSLALMGLLPLGARFPARFPNSAHCPRLRVRTALRTSPHRMYRGNTRASNHRKRSRRPLHPRLMETLLTAHELCKTYRRGTSAFSRSSDDARFTAVDGVSFDVARGETFAIVGESGCGKTTLARMLLLLIEPDRGEIRFEDRDLLALRGGELRSLRRRMQMVFQDPFASLNPRMRVSEIVSEPLAIHEPSLSAKVRLARTMAILQRSASPRKPCAAILTNSPAASASASASPAP